MLHRVHSFERPGGPFILRGFGPACRASARLTQAHAPAKGSADRPPGGRSHEEALLVLATLVVYLLHQDVWFWRSARPLVFGFLPIGLFYHACYAVARLAADVAAGALRLARPPRARGGAAPRGPPAVIPTADRLRLPGGRPLHRHLRLPPARGQGGGRGLLPRRPLARPVRVPDVALRHEHDGLRDPRLVRPRLRATGS